MQTAEHSNRPLNSSHTNKRWWKLFVVALILLGAGFGARVFLLNKARISKVEPPLPREGLPAPYIKTDEPIVEKMIELAELSQDDLVYDLGCGDGRLVITAALASGCRGVGFDIEPKRIAESQENASRQGVDDRVTFKEQDVFTVDLSEADVVLAYLLPWMLEKMRPQFVQMKPGARIVLHDFWIEGVEPDQFVEVESTSDGGNTHGIYVYVLPLKLNPNLERLKPPRPRNWNDGRDAAPSQPTETAGADTSD